MRGLVLCLFVICLIPSWSGAEAATVVIDTVVIEEVVSCEVNDCVKTETTKTTTRIFYEEQTFCFTPSCSGAQAIPIGGTQDGPQYPFVYIPNPCINNNVKIIDTGMRSFSGPVYQFTDAYGSVTREMPDCSILTASVSMQSVGFSDQVRQWSEDQVSYGKRFIDLDCPPPDTTVPEPSTFALVAIGIVVVSLVQRGRVCNSIALGPSASTGQVSSPRAVGNRLQLRWGVLNTQSGPFHPLVQRGRGCN